MAWRPYSLDHEGHKQIKLRRPQRAKIKAIIDANRATPLIALGLVRDYAKGIQDIRNIAFDNDEAPTYIVVFTHKHGFLDGTVYNYRLTIPKHREAPLL